MRKQKKISGELKWIIKNARPQASGIVVLTVFYSVLAYVGVFNAQIARYLIDSAVSGDINGIVLYGGIFGAVIAGQFGLRIVSNHLIFTINAKMEISIKSNLFQTILQKEYKQITAYHSGELVNRLTSDVTVITNAVTTILPQLVYLIVKLTGIFIFLMGIDPVFAVVFLAGGIILYGFTRLFKRVLKTLHMKIQETDGKTRSFMQEVLSNLLVVKVFNNNNRVTQSLDALQYDNYTVRKKRNWFSVFSGSGLSFVFAAAYLYGLIWGGLNIVEGVITYGTLTAVLSLITQIQAPINELSNIFPRYYAAVGSAQRIMEIESIPGEQAVNGEDRMDIPAVYQWLESMEFSNVTFSYDRDMVIKNAAIKINKGDFAVITGMSGIGKSTFIKLLMGIYQPDRGEVRFNSVKGGYYKADKNLRGLFAFVPQGNFILSGTIRENVAFTKPEATDEEIQTALKISCADGFVNSFPDGVYTKIGEKGQGLSEGQGQRIAIARAILSGAPILILDESTSALDEETEQNLLYNIKNLKHKTCIIISHKNAAARVCNKEIRIIDKEIEVLEISHD